MQFGLFTTLYDCGGGAETPAAVLDHLREQVVLAEQLGYDAVWMGEHHFGPYGLGDLPNPILVGADLAVRTSRIRIGQMANIAPWWHPIRLAEDLALLDNLTRGRVDVGFGRGIWPYEGPQFHPHADPRKDAENRELFRETVEIVRKAWTEERFAHQGPNYTFPAPDTRFAHPRYPPDPAWQDGDRVLKLRVTPKPYQRPHPPLWMTVSTDRSVSFAAELGLRPCYWQPPPRRVRQRMELYAGIRSRLEGRPVSPSAGQGVLRNLYVAPTMEAARREAEAPILSAFIYNDPFRGREVFTNPGEELPPGTNARLGVPRAAHPPGRVAGARRRAGAGAGGGLRAGDAPGGARASGIPQRLILRNLSSSRRRSCLPSGGRRRRCRPSAPRADARPRIAMAPVRQLIDWHTHCYLPVHMGAESRAVMQARGVIGGEAWPEHHRRGVVEGGAEKFVVIKMPTKSGRGIPNDFIAEYVGQYPGRAVGFAAIDPTEGDAAAELERCVTKLGLRGLKLSPVYHGYDPWSPAVWRLYEMADAFRIPVMFHMGGAYDPEAALEWGSPLLLDRVARAFPRLRMIVAHLGQPMMQETVMLLRKNENVFADSRRASTAGGGSTTVCASRSSTG